MLNSNRSENKMGLRHENSYAAADELQARNEILVNRVNNLQNYIKQLAHDLKTPLTPLVGASELLASSIDEQPWSDLALSIRVSAENLLRMVDELLDLERCDCGTLTLNYSAFDPVRPVTEGAKKAEAGVPPSRATIALNLSPTPLRVWADEMRLRQVITILVTDAIKFSPGGAKVVVSVIPGEATTGFTVEDEGPPIDAGDLAHIFEPYQSVHGPGRRIGSNGLTLAKRLIELQGGNIGANNASKSGNIFWFDLPVEKSMVEEVATWPRS